MDLFIPMRNAGRKREYIIARVALMLFMASAPGYGQSADVTLHVDFVQNAPAPHALTAPPTTVAWLTPLGATAANAPPLQTHTYQMEQKNKMFDPHLLVVPLGSIVVFPNRDPFFHNVFSLFNGKRFDLGLYETGSKRSVRFDREGVSFIFCNIHPEMGAVILSLATPYYAVSHESMIAIAQVPPGKYRLNVWSEGATPESLNAARRSVTVAAVDIDLGVVSLVAAPSPIMNHANKFGEPYAGTADSTSLGSVY